MSLAIFIEHAEARLIREAHWFADDRNKGLMDVDGEYEKYSISLKTSLAKECHSLAGKAGVSEKAAFLALMQILDN
jgi:hypothetical protein